MNVKNLKQWLADKKDDAIVEVIVHNRAVDFSLCLEGNSEGCDDYDSVDFYVDELCQSENVQEREAAAGGMIR
jgi:hypothetical protein